MTVYNTRFFLSSERGASLIEVVLAMAIAGAALPFIYSQISRTNREIKYMKMAHEITGLRNGVLNFVRMNQDAWPDVAQIKLTDEELNAISDMPTSAFIDKYSVRGAYVTDVYLSFDIDATEYDTNLIARHIGADAAIVGPDGVAYGASWAVAAPGFAPGNLVYKISRDFSDIDNSKYLHRATSGEDDLNVMLRDLNMGGYNMLSIGGISADSADMKNVNVAFAQTPDMLSSNVYFSSGVTVNGDAVSIGNMRVTGDIVGFRNIYATRMNGTGYSTNGHIITDRATIGKSVNVSHDFKLKSGSLRTISAFTGITTNSVATPFLSTEEIVFYDNFGLTVSGELLMSTNAPIKIGNWSFPSKTPPSFKTFNLLRGKLSATPDKSEFRDILTNGWQDIR